MKRKRKELSSPGFSDGVLCAARAVAASSKAAATQAKFLARRGAELTFRREARAQGKEEARMGGYSFLSSCRCQGYCIQYGRRAWQLAPSARATAMLEAVKRVHVIDSHTAGEPTRLVVNGGP